MAYRFGLVDPKDTKSVRGVRRLWTNAYGKGEVEPYSETVAGMSGEYSVLYRIFAAWDDKGRVVAAIAGGVDKLDENEAVYMVGYMNTDPKHVRKGLARELVRLAIEQALSDAAQMGCSLVAITAEATSDSEEFWNAVGLARLYLQTGNINEYIELQYVQPALDFNPATGRPAEGAEEVPEHLMLGFFDREADKELVSKLVAAVLRWSHRWAREEFKSDEAYATHVAYTDFYQNTFDTFLHANGNLVGMTKADREGLIQKGVTVIDYALADAA